MKAIENPKDIADNIYMGFKSEFDKIYEENQKRIENFQEPLPMPDWNVKKMLESVNNLTKKIFANPHFCKSWNGKTSEKEWATIARETLKNDYLRKIAKIDPDLHKQMLEIWRLEFTPEPTLTEQQMAELSELQLKADAIMERAEGLLQDFMKLAEQEKNIVLRTQSKWDTRIANQVKYLKGNMSSYYEKYVVKW